MTLDSKRIYLASPVTVSAQELPRPFTPEVLEMLRGYDAQFNGQNKAKGNWGVTIHYDGGEPVMVSLHQPERRIYLTSTKPRA